VVGVGCDSCEVGEEAGGVAGVVGGEGMRREAVQI